MQTVGTTKQKEMEMEDTIVNGGIEMEAGAIDAGGLPFVPESELIVTLKAGGVIEGSVDDTGNITAVMLESERAKAVGHIPETWSLEVGANGELYVITNCTRECRLCVWAKAYSGFVLARQSLADAVALVNESVESFPLVPGKGRLIATEMKEFGGVPMPLPVYRYFVPATETTAPSYHDECPFLGIALQQATGKVDAVKPRAARKPAAPAEQTVIPGALRGGEAASQEGKITVEPMPVDFPNSMMSFNRDIRKAGKGTSWYVEIGGKTLRYREWLTKACGVMLVESHNNLPAMDAADWLRVAAA